MLCPSVQFHLIFAEVVVALEAEVLVVGVNLWAVSAVGLKVSVDAEVFSQEGLQQIKKKH